MKILLPPGCVLADPGVPEPASQPACYIQHILHIITHGALQAPRMSSPDPHEVILVPTWQPPAPQTLQNHTVVLGFYNVSQMLSWTTLDEFGMPKAPKNRSKQRQYEPKELLRNPKALPSEAPKHQREPQGPPRTPEVTDKASITCKKHAKVTQKASQVRSSTPQGQKNDTKLRRAFGPRV